MRHLRTTYVQYIPRARIWEYYVVDVDREVERLTEAMECTLTFCPCRAGLPC